MIYADVILPLPLHSTFTYRVPDSMEREVNVGSRILVQFGKKKYYTAIVVCKHPNAPDYEVKDIIEVLDPYPIVRQNQLRLWKWISDYYLCSQGDVYKAAVPAGLKVESETEVRINPDYEQTPDEYISEKDLEVLGLVGAREKVRIADISKALDRNVEGSIQRLIEHEAVIVCERIVDNYRSKTETCVKLNAQRDEEASLHKCFDAVARAQKQETLLMTFLQLSQWMNQSAELKEVTKKELLKHSGISAAVLTAMVQKGIFTIYKRDINRFATKSSATHEISMLTAPQLQALHEIRESFVDKNITLLRGVTSSGKTEIYIHLIDSVLRSGRQALYLVPEIALTTQLTQRLEKVFGNRLLIYHSKFSDNERVDIWRKLLRSAEPYVVIGVRSSVLLPFSNLALVIVDEEHETSYKQQDPAPRYNARNVAMILAQLHGAKTLLGSGTPAIDSYYNATSGKYGLVELLVRHEGIEMPDVQLIDINDCYKKKEMRGMFSLPLIKACNDSLENGKQTILFQNRRGYAPRVTCKECAWIPKCENCDVTLTYHKHTASLTCHYCGYTIQLPSFCPACKQPALEVVGYGTERIEDEVEEVFSNAKIARMDLDTTRKKNSYDQIIENFSQGKSQILVGTQMVTKGLDFGGVNLVGVLNADNTLNFPDFRSTERAFNMLEQVAGRAGRKGGRGKVLVQTRNVEHPLFPFLINHDYLGYYKMELEERRKFVYPPFSKIIDIYIKHRKDGDATIVAEYFAKMLRSVFAHRVLGPETPNISRVQQLYIRKICIKMEPVANMARVREIIRNIYENLLATRQETKSAIIYYDVDPM